MKLAADFLVRLPSTGLAYLAYTVLLLEKHVCAKYVSTFYLHVQMMYLLPLVHFYEHGLPSFCSSHLFFVPTPTPSDQKTPMYVYILVWIIFKNQFPLPRFSEMNREPICLASAVTLVDRELGQLPRGIVRKKSKFVLLLFESSLLNSLKLWLNLPIRTWPLQV